MVGKSARPPAGLSLPDEGPRATGRPSKLTVRRDRRPATIYNQRRQSIRFEESNGGRRRSDKIASCSSRAFVTRNEILIPLGLDSQAAIGNADVRVIAETASERERNVGRLSSPERQTIWAAGSEEARVVNSREHFDSAAGWCRHGLQYHGAELVLRRNPEYRDCPVPASHCEHALANPIEHLRQVERYPAGLTLWTGRPSACPRLAEAMPIVSMIAIVSADSRDQHDLRSLVARGMRPSILAITSYHRR